MHFYYIRQGQENEKFNFFKNLWFKLKNILVRHCPHVYLWKTCLRMLLSFFNYCFALGEHGAYVHSSIVGSKPLWHSCGRNLNTASAFRAVWVKPMLQHVMTKLEGFIASMMKNSSPKS